MHVLEHQSEKKECQASLWSVSWQNTTGPRLPFSHMSLSTTNKLSKLSADHSLCSTACPGFLHIPLLCKPSSSPEHTERPLRGSSHGCTPPGPTNPTGKRRALLFPQPLGKRWKTAKLGPQSEMPAPRVHGYCTLAFPEAAGADWWRKKRLATMWASIYLHYVFI